MSPRPDSSRKRLAVLAVACALVGVVQSLSWFGLYTFVNGYLTKALGFSNADWTASTLWFLAGMLVGQFLCTEVASVLGRRHTVILGMLVSAGAYGALAMTERLFAVRITMVFMAFMPAVTVVVWLSLVAEIGRHRPGRSLSIFVFVATLAGAGTMAAGGWLKSRTTYPGLFAWASGTCVACAVGFALVARLLPGKEGMKARSVFRLARSDVKHLLTGPFLVASLVGLFLEPLLALTMNQLFPNLARDRHGMDESAIIHIVALGRLPALACVLILGRYVDRLRAGMCYGVGMVLVAAGVVAMALTTSQEAMVASYLFYYLAYGVIWSSNLATVNRSVRADLREAAFAVSTAGATVGVLLVGALHNRLLAAGMTLPNLFVLCGAAAAAAGAILILYFGLRRPAGDTGRNLPDR